MSNVATLFIQGDGAKLPVTRAYINATAAGATALVAAQGAGIRVRVLAISIVCETAVSVHLRSATTPISSTKAFGANGGMFASDHLGLYDTAPNEALNLYLGGIANVGVDITWVAVRVAA